MHGVDGVAAMLQAAGAGESEEGEISETSSPVVNAAAADAAEDSSNHSTPSNDPMNDTNSHDDDKNTPGNVAPGKDQEVSAMSASLQPQQPNKEDDEESSSTKMDVQAEAQPKEQEETPAVEPTAPTYSTRGRSDPPSAPDNKTSLKTSSHHDAPLSPGAEELHLHTTATSTTAHPSFLSDSLTEEERRTRTRYVPAVPGMHLLRKHEIKADLGLARNHGQKRKHPKQQQNQDQQQNQQQGTDTEDDASNTNETDSILSKSPAVSEDEFLRQLPAGSKAIALDDTHLVLPCHNVFVPPESNKTNNKSSASKNSSSATSTVQPSPRVVQAVSAFNPPRPPESIGTKKKHRLLRWERRPQDMPVDLQNYRKTVARTQHEWEQTTQQLQDQVQVENLQRHHLLRWQLHLQRQVQDCQRQVHEVVSQHNTTTALAETRTRSKAGPNLRDMMLELQQQPLSSMTATSSSAMTHKPLCGLGGVTAASWSDSVQDKDTSTAATTEGTCWIVPGETVLVQTSQQQEEEGTVLAVPVYGEPPQETKDPDAMDVDSPPETLSKKKTTEKGTATTFGPPKVAVKLTGSEKIVHVAPEQLQIKNDIVQTYSDEQLAQRWKALYETAKAVAPMIDIPNGPSEDNNDQDESTVLEKSSLLPKGEELLPTAHGRTSLLLQVQKQQKEKPGDNNKLQQPKQIMQAWDIALEKPLHKGGGNVGFRGNRNVPPRVRALEVVREEKLLLQARSLQLRNKVVRQRRIRLLNERTLSATQERAVKVKELVAEMRADLKSLKTRLDEEIRELGISEQQAETILAAYFRSLESQQDMGAENEPETAAQHDDASNHNDLEEQSGDEPAAKRLRAESEDEHGQVLETTEL